MIVQPSRSFHTAVPTAKLLIFRVRTADSQAFEREAPKTMIEPDFDYDYPGGVRRWFCHWLWHWLWPDDGHSFGSYGSDMYGKWGNWPKEDEGFWA